MKGLSRGGKEEEKEKERNTCEREGGRKGREGKRRKIVTEKGK